MFRNLEAEQARFGYTNQQMADKSMMFATDNEPREKGGDNDRNDGYFLVISVFGRFGIISTFFNR